MDLIKKREVSKKTTNYKQNIYCKLINIGGF
jgi:hypothetical protein